MPIDPNLNRDELQQLINEATAALRNIEQQQQANEQTLKDAARRRRRHNNLQPYIVLNYIIKA